VGKKSRLIQAVSISTAIVISNISLAAANNTSNSSISSDERSLAQINMQSNVLRRTTTEPAWTSSNSETNTPIKKTIAQTPAANQSEATQDNTADIIKPPQQPIPSTDPLNPSPNPLSFPTQADEVKVGTEQPITLEQAIEIALKNNKEIEEARIQVERSEAVLREARASLYPTFDLESGFSYSDQSLLLDNPIEQELRDANPDATDEQIQQEVDSQLEASPTKSFTFSNGLGLNYNIYDSGRRGATIRSAEKELRTTELELERIVEEARFETARDYYDLQNNDALIRIEEAAVEDASQTLKDAQLLKQAGLGTRFDVVSAEVELSQAQQRLITAQANQNIARRQLAETLSVSHDTDLATADAIEEAGTWKLSLPETIVQAFKNRAELEQFLLQREIGEENRTIALSQIRPRVSASASYGLSDDFEDNIGFTDNYSLGLQAQWRLFDGGAARASAEQAEKDSQLAETRFSNQRNQIRFGVEQAYFALESSRKNIATSTKEVELAQESLRLARLRFQAGVGTQTEVIDAQTQLTTARGNLLSSIIDYNQSYNQLQRQVSNTPDNGLQDLP
jgi:outer membrane protein TolC